MSNLQKLGPSDRLPERILPKIVLNASLGAALGLSSGDAKQLIR